MSVCFLDTLQPQFSHCSFGQLGTGGQLGYDGKRVFVQGEPLDHCLSAHATSRVLYRLDRRFASLDLAVAFNDDVPFEEDIVADFDIFLDGRTAASAKAMRPGTPPVALSVAAEGVGWLELAITAERRRWAHTLWVDPHLTVLDGARAKGGWSQNSGDNTTGANAKYTLADITIVVSSFLRFDCLRRFLISARYYYPRLSIVVADQSGDEAQSNPDAVFCKSIPNVHWLELPYDCGLSAARNAAVEAVSTKLVFVADDDEVFMDDTRIEALLDVHNHDQRVSLVCGLIRAAWHGGNVARCWHADLTLQQGGVLHAVPVNSTWQMTPDGTWYRMTHRYINVFLASRELLKRYPWNERHKIKGEHLDHVMQLWSDEVGVAYTPQCIIGEMSSNNAEYRLLRQRSCDPDPYSEWGVKRQTGLSIAEPEPGVTCVPTSLPNTTSPNIVILTVGHTGSTLLAGWFSGLGWNIPDCDACYNEPIAVREANDAMTCGQVFDCEALVQSLRQPWVLKDPRFCETLDAWVPAFAASRPLLLWLERDMQVVLQSWQRRGEGFERLQSRLRLAEKHFLYWPWAKQRVSYETIASWFRDWQPHNR